MVLMYAALGALLAAVFIGLSPAVEARVSSGRPLPLGEEVRVKLVEAAPDQRRVRFPL